MKRVGLSVCLVPLFAIFFAACGGSGGAGSTPTYSISGTIIFNGTGHAGVTVALSGASTASTLTDISGEYSFTDLSDGDYTITPSLINQSLTPGSRNLSIAGSSITGVDFDLDTYTISGQVAHGGAGESGVSMSLSGMAAGAATTDGSGNYSFTGLLNGSYTVSPTLYGQVFAPASTTVSVSSASQANVDFNIPQIIWYVDIDSPVGTPDGLSWGTAFLHPQNGSDMAMSGDQVWVAEGTYASMDTVTPMPVLSMQDGVGYYGGFAGTESMVSERDLSAHSTILDGEGLVNHVVIGASNARLDGFFITRGDAGAASGGGMSNEGVTGLQVMNSIFASNVATGDGGGMHNDNAEVEVGNCVFRNNSAFHGGGLENYSNCDLLIYDSIFINNSASHGAAMHLGGGPDESYIGGHDVDIYNCLIVGNQASGNNGGVTYVNSTGNIVNTTIINNSSGGSGGGVYNHASSPVINNSIIYDNSPVGITNVISGGAAVTYTDVQGGYAGTGNIDADPVFNYSADDDYRLSSTSPCLNVGDNSAVTTSFDLAGVDRILDTTVDMGAYEGAFNKALRVDLDSAAGDPDGLSWPTAFTHPDTAMNYANADDEIWVAEGTYATLDTSDATVPVLEMEDGVLVYGGFAGTESSLTQRDPDVYIAVLDGEGFVNHVVVGASDARLDGFFVTRGNAGAASGAGMSNENITGLQVMNSVFASNVATGDGGGMHNDNAEVEVDNCIFRNNTAYHGGGIENYSNCTLVIRDSVIMQNSGTHGGAMHFGGGPAEGYIGGHQVDIYNSLVIDNAASGNNGGITYVNSTGTVENTTIANNTSGGAGGGNYNHASSPVIVNSIIYANTPAQVSNAVSGGAVVLYSDVQGGYTGTGNIDSDPLFSDAANDDYRLDSTSPCIDTGNNAAVSTSFDLDGNPRIVDGPDMDSTATVDMGAYEY